MKKFDQINMIPFIDIMLVLLAIVLTTASFVSNEILEIELPSADESKPTSQTESIVISVDQKGVFFLEETEVPLLDMRNQLAKVDRATFIRLSIDKSAEFQDFISLVNILRSLELSNFSIEILPELVDGQL